MSSLRMGVSFRERVKELVGWMPMVWWPVVRGVRVVVMVKCENVVGVSGGLRKPIMAVWDESIVSVSTGLGFLWT